MRREVIVYGRRRSFSAAPAGAGPMDRDGDGKPGGSLPASARGLENLIAEAAALGIKVDRRWGEKRLRKEIAKAREK